MKTERYLDQIRDEILEHISNFTKKGILRNFDVRTHAFAPEHGKTMAESKEAPLEMYTASMHSKIEIDHPFVVPFTEEAYRYENENIRGELLDTISISSGPKSPIEIEEVDVLIADYEGEIIFLGPNRKEQKIEVPFNNGSKLSYHPDSEIPWREVRKMLIVACNSIA